MILDAGGLGVVSVLVKIGGFRKTARNIETPVFGGLFSSKKQHPVQILSLFLCFLWAEGGAMAAFTVSSCFSLG